MDNTIKRAFALLSALILLLPAAAWALTIHLEAVNYTSSFNAGGDGIRAVNGALSGLDYPGDYVCYNLKPTSFGFYGVTIRCWGVNGYPYEMQLIIEDIDQNAQVVDIYFVGKGTCGS